MPVTLRATAVAFAGMSATPATDKVDRLATRQPRRGSDPLAAVHQALRRERLYRPVADAE